MAKILILDDSSTETYKLTNILERNDHLVLSAESVVAGLSSNRGLPQKDSALFLNIEPDRLKM